MTCGLSRWDSPGKKTRDLLHRVSHKFTATRVCLACQGPQTRLPGPPPPPDPHHQTKQAQSCRRMPFALDRYGRCPLFLCVAAMSIGLGTKPGHQEADAEGWAWVRLSEHPCSLVLLGVSGLSVDEEGKARRPPFDPLLLSSFLPSSSRPPPLPLPSPFPGTPVSEMLSSSLALAPPWPSWPWSAVCSPVWACPPRSPKTAYPAGAGSALVHNGLRPLGHSRGLKASVHSFADLVSEAPPEHLPLRCPG